MVQEKHVEILTIVPKKLPPYFPWAPFILKHPRVKIWEIIVSGYNAVTQIINEDVSEGEKMDIVNKMFKK